MIIAEGSHLVAVRTSDFGEIGDLSSFRTAKIARLEVEPEGNMVLPSWRVTNRTAGDYRVHQSMLTLPDGNFPAATPFPKMIITKLENAYCLPFAPPVLPTFGRIVTDYLIPWAPEALGWFSHRGNDAYTANVTINTDQCEFDIDTAFYLDHSISGHFGHFIGDCLPRMYAWDVCRAIFGDVKLIIAGRAPIDFQTHLLNAAGVPSRDIVRINGLVRCRCLLLATQSLGVEHYASPTSARMLATIRDRSAARDVGLPDRIYLSRASVGGRKLANEGSVERIFERFGFTVIRPETLRVEMQIALVSNARLIAGPGGSGMFNLAFQGRLRSAFLLVWEEFIQLSEMLLSAGRGCDIWYHVGRRVQPESESGGAIWTVDLARLENDVAEWLIQTRS